MKRKDVEKRLLERRAITRAGCWELMGSVTKDGYGRIYYNGQNLHAHRVSAMLYLGLDLDSSLQVNHKCETKRCFNPEHLYIGTQSDNIKQAFQEGKVHPPTMEERKASHDELKRTERQLRGWRQYAK